MSQLNFPASLIFTPQAVVVGLNQALKVMTGKELSLFVPNTRLMPGKPLLLDPPHVADRPLLRVVRLSVSYLEF